MTESSIQAYFHATVMFAATGWPACCWQQKQKTKIKNKNLTANIVSEVKGVDVEVGLGVRWDRSFLVDRSVKVYFKKTLYFQNS